MTGHYPPVCVQWLDAVRSDSTALQRLSAIREDVRVSCIERVYLLITLDSLESMVSLAFVVIFSFQRGRSHAQNQAK